MGCAIAVNLFYLFFIIISCLFSSSAFAICPVCTIAVGAGIGFSEWLGIDDVITGLWIGGLIISLIIWTLHALRKKQINIFADKMMITIFYYLLIILPLYPMGFIGDPSKRLWHIDKLLLGITVGSLFFLLGNFLHCVLKNYHGKSYFPFQKVALPILPLIILSLIFYKIIT
jgi:hypothetical protein